jgi:PAS domain S-box-containing protein
MTDLRAFFDNLVAGVIIHSGSGRVLDANPMAAKLMGLLVSQMVGRGLDDQWGLLDGQGQPIAVEDYPVSRVLRTGEPLHNLVVGVAQPPGEEVHWLLCNAYIERNSVGEIHRVVMMLLDATDMIKVRKSLAAMERRYRMLFENTMDAVLITRPDGAIVAANPAAEALFGATEREIIAAGRDGLCDVTDPRLGELIALRARDGRAAGTHRMRRSDGTMFEADTTSVLYDDDGQTLNALVIRRHAG